MVRRFDGGKLVIASHNAGKVREIDELLREFSVEPISAGDLGLPEPEETGLTYVENAELKSLASARRAQLPALADDSGLSVTALDGDPGIYSARWAGPDRDFRIAMARVNRELEDKVDRSASFVCVLSLAWPDGHTENFKGRVRGQIVNPPRGDGGFGYDPIFVPDGYDTTFAEMDQSWKHSISHRTVAFEKLVEVCFA